MASTEDEELFGSRSDRPSEFLRFAEDEAVQAAKFLRANRNKLDSSSGKAAVEDALKLSDLISVLAEAGQRLEAEDAIEIAGRVERFLDLLITELEGMRTQTK